MELIGGPIYDSLSTFAFMHPLTRTSSEQPLGRSSSETSPNSSPEETTVQLPSGHIYGVHTMNILMIMILNKPETVPDINLML